MAQPQVPIDVDADTGIWRTDGLPMVYLPRHFLVNMQKGVEAAIGPEAYREILYASSDLSALQWCRAEAKTHGLTPVDTFRHYLKRLIAARIRPAGHHVARRKRRDGHGHGAPFRLRARLWSRDRAGRLLHVRGQLRRRHALRAGDGRA